MYANKNRNTHDTAPTTLIVCNMKSIYEGNSIYIKGTIFLLSCYFVHPFLIAASIIIKRSRVFKRSIHRKPKARTSFFH